MLRHDTVNPLFYDSRSKPTPTAKLITHLTQRVNLPFVPMHNPENRADQRPANAQRRWSPSSQNQVPDVALLSAVIHANHKKFP